MLDLSQINSAIPHTMVASTIAMTTQEGRTLRLSDLRGDVVVLTFIYTRCPLGFCRAREAGTG